METPNENSRRPDGFDEHPEAVMSNFDHEINQEVAEAIKNKPLYSLYAGWNFCGYVWYENNKWCCEVLQYCSHQTTVVADTLEEIMSEVCNSFGDE